MISSNQQTALFLCARSTPSQVDAVYIQGSLTDGAIRQLDLKDTRELNVQI